MLTSKSARWAAIALVVAVALGIVLYPTDEKRVRAAAEAIVSAANGSSSELGQALDTYAVPDVSIDAAELAAPLSGRDAIVAAVAIASRAGHNLRFRVEGVDVTLDGNRARVTADLITTLRAEVPELRRPRHSVALFEKRNGTFRLVSAEIGAERQDQPEARP
jgi:SnoaL-like protein